LDLLEEMNVEKLLSLLPPELLTELAFDTRVNHYAKKLQGEVVFKLLLYCIITCKDNSLRTMECAYEKMAFQLLNRSGHKGSVKFNSISERLATIEVGYFEKLYGACVEAYKNILQKERDELVRFDSTIVTLSSDLLKVGYHLKGGDAEEFRQLKFTVGLSDIPEIVHFFTELKYTNENVALKESILAQAKKDTETIKVFDRGISGRHTYDEFTENSIQFVSRINANAKHELQQPAAEQLTVQTATLTIVSDSWCYLFNSHQKRTKYPVRLIKAIRIADNTVVVFITNIASFDAAVITEIYKRRWDIEVFFKFIKQLLNFNHLINRSENGIKVVLYVTMIAAILILAYKKINSLKGFKIVKQKFEQELEKAIMKDIVILCGGNPEKLDYLLFEKDP
jgi:Transposase DDE domain